MGSGAPVFGQCKCGERSRTPHVIVEMRFKRTFEGVDPWTLPLVRDLPKIREASPKLRRWLDENWPGYSAFVGCETGAHRSGKIMHDLDVDQQIYAYEAGILTYVETTEQERSDPKTRALLYMHTFYVMRPNNS